MSFSYANAASGPSAGGIGWCNFNNISLMSGGASSSFSGTLKDGTTVTFDIAAINDSGAARNFTATTAPTWGGTFFGNSNYTGTAGTVAMQTNYVFAPSSNSMVMTNIVVKDSLGNAVPNYTVVIADAESTGVNESWTLTTNGLPWKLFATLGNSSSPTLTGVNTSVVSFTGSTPGQNENDYVLTTNSPTALNLNTATTNTGGGLEAVAIGFAVTKVIIEKNIGKRIDSNDQFELEITGTPSSVISTTGGANGIQTQKASVFAIAGNTYSINEAMAAGSVSVLTDYNIATSASNLIPAGTVPPLGALPINFTPALGDIVTYTILNAAPETFTKSVNKTYSDIGEVLTYTVSITNPNDFAINNVKMTDATPTGTIYIGNLVVSSPYVGTSPSGGITILTITPNATVTISWQVQVNTTPPITNPVTNIATVTIPNGTSGVTNIVATTVQHARIAINKVVDKAFADTNDILTYTLTLNNLGNVAANNVVITDVIPAGTTYVAGSITGSVTLSGTPNTTITLGAPIPAGGFATINFKAKISATIPSINPVANNSSVKYTFTVDPAMPNAQSGAATSNTVTTLISNAKLDIIKSTDKTISYIGDVVTYTISVKNTGNIAANNVVLSDILPNGAAYIAGTFTASVPYINTPSSAVQLVNAIAPGEIVYISFQVKVVSMPNPNPLKNSVTSTFFYTINPNMPNGVSGSSASNVVQTVVFRNNYAQQISDLIESVALEEAALAAIANAEGAKIQKIVAMQNVTTQQLLCLNRSVSDMMDSLALLESILKQKLAIVDCQISGETC